MKQPTGSRPSIKSGTKRLGPYNAGVAANYVKYTLIVDPAADAVIEALAPFDPMQVHQFIHAGMERQEDVLRETPAVLGDFFERISVPPSWFDPTNLLPGMLAYHQNSDLFIAAHVAGVLVEGFAMTISKPFFMTGRLTDHGIRRLQHNRHPCVLSLSEFFSAVGMGVFRRRRVTGSRMWELYTRQQTRTRLMLRGNYDELLYPVDDPNARFSRRDMPPIMGATLPHLTDQYEALFDELEPVVNGQPTQPPALHFRRLFEWLCQRLRRNVWAERSGGSLVFAYRLLSRFPDARIIHVYRDGRETALSMSRHYVFRTFVAAVLAFRRVGIDVNRLMAGSHYWDRISPWLDLLTKFSNPDRLPYDKLTLADFGLTNGRC